MDKRGYLHNVNVNGENVQNTLAECYYNWLKLFIQRILLLTTLVKIEIQVLYIIYMHPYRIPLEITKERFKVHTHIAYIRIFLCTSKENYVFFFYI